MRWFKHFTTARENVKLSKLRDAHGWAGYGLYFAVIEIINQQFSPENLQISVEFSRKNWRNYLNLTPKKQEIFFKTCHELGLLNVKISEKLIWVESPKMYKYCDENTKKRLRNSGVTPELVRVTTPELVRVTNPELTRTEQTRTDYYSKAEPSQESPPEEKTIGGFPETDPPEVGPQWLATLSPRRRTVGALAPAVTRLKNYTPKQRAQILEYAISNAHEVLEDYHYDKADTRPPEKPMLTLAEACAESERREAEYRSQSNDG